MPYLVHLPLALLMTILPIPSVPAAIWPHHFTQPMPQVIKEVSSIDIPTRPLKHSTPILSIILISSLEFVSRRVGPDSISMTQPILECPFVKSS